MKHQRGAETRSVEEVGRNEHNSYFDCDKIITIRGYLLPIQWVLETSLDRKDK
jgi:hypothetical protein